MRDSSEQEDRPPRRHRGSGQTEEKPVPAGSPPAGGDFPSDPGLVHFIGAGGTGMSGIAEVMHAMGYRIQGSDLQENAAVRRLVSLGVKVFPGHDPGHLAGVDTVVVSSAIGEDNPELREARRRGLVVVRRSRMLAGLMRPHRSIGVAGSHGKTTTTSLAGAIMDAAGKQPTIINGGVINAYRTSARLGNGDWIVVETDESDGSFLELPVLIPVVTCIDAEHVRHYGSFDALREAFALFVRRIPPDSRAILCADHPETRRLAGNMPDRALGYGLSGDADLRGSNLRRSGTGTLFDLTFSGRCRGGRRRIRDVLLAMPGRHNVLNALGAALACNEAGADTAAIRAGIAGFAGVRRRFTITGCVRGLTVVDDYGHHPAEIAATIGTARELYGAEGLVAIVQPHRYSRLQDLMEEMADVLETPAHVILTPVCSAGEPPVPGVSSEALADRLRRRGRNRVSLAGTAAEAARLVLDTATGRGGVVLCLGAGSITAWAQELPGLLAAAAGDGQEEPQTDRVRRPGRA